MMQMATTIMVFYATDRSRREARYTTKPDYMLHYGLCEVSIPPSHQPGKVESSNNREQANPLQHFILVGDEPISDPIFFWHKLRNEVCAQLITPSQNSHSAMMLRLPPNAREVLLYIHGFNVTFERALKTAAQLKHDLEFRGLVILYSWPTRERMFAYHRDRKVILGSAGRLRELIETILMEKVASTKVHILAHSMGNRALIEALTQPGWNPLRNEESSRRRGVLTNVILAAADEVLDKFQEMLPEMDRQNSVHRPVISVYSSACDRALFASARLNWCCLRLGYTKSLFRDHSMRAIPDSMVDVIDASGVPYDNSLQHSYYAEVPAVLYDIKNLLANDRREQNRLPQLIHRYPPHPDWNFYAFVPEWWYANRSANII
ncbi:unnamed protein product [Sphagnum troendelagicum]